MSRPILRWIKGPYQGLAHKIKFAREAYWSSLLRPEVRDFAENAAGPGNRLTQARRLFATLREVVPYYGDCIGVETTKAPWQMIEEIRGKGFSGGDCDDKATFVYVLLRLIGIPNTLRVAWYGDKQQPQHIYNMVNVKGRWYPFDTTLPVFGEERPAREVKDFS